MQSRYDEQYRWCDATEHLDLISEHREQYVPIACTQSWVFPARQKLQGGVNSYPGKGHQAEPVVAPVLALLSLLLLLLADEELVLLDDVVDSVAAFEDPAKRFKQVRIVCVETSEAKQFIESILLHWLWSCSV